MDVNPRQFVLLVLEAAGGEIPGKTYFQKLCFFVGVKAGNSALGYRPHYYGPYSDSVASEISFLKSAGFVSERQRGSGFPDSAGWEVTRFDYSITDDGKAVVRRDLVLSPVGSIPGGANKWGVLDLVGNVWEWTSTKASAYKGANPEIAKQIEEKLGKDNVAVRGAFNLSGETMAVNKGTSPNT